MSAEIQNFISDQFAYYQENEDQCQKFYETQFKNQLMDLAKLQIFYLFIEHGKGRVPRFLFRYAKGLLESAKKNTKIRQRVKRWYEKQVRIIIRKQQLREGERREREREEENKDVQVKEEVKE